MDRLLGLAPALAGMAIVLAIGGCQPVDRQQSGASMVAGERLSDTGTGDAGPSGAGSATGTDVLVRTVPPAEAESDPASGPGARSSKRVKLPGLPGVPPPVEAFEMFCYGPRGTRAAALRLVKVMDLPEVPEQVRDAFAPVDDDGGTLAYVVVLEKPERRAIIVALGREGICSVSSSGYDLAKSRTFMQEHYKLEEWARNETGLQVSEFFFPAGRDSDGVISIMSSKFGDPTMTIAYMAPEAAEELPARREGQGQP